MDALTSLIVILFIVLCVFLGIRLMLGRDSKKPQGPTPYQEALHALIDGQNDLAFQKLKEAIAADYDNVDPLIRLGNLLRSRNHMDQALRIHQDVAARSGLPKFQYADVYRQLCLDYEKLGNHPKALEMIDRILQIEPGHSWARRKQVKLFEKNRQWLEAFNALKSLVEEFKIKYQLQDVVLPVSPTLAPLPETKRESMPVSTAEDDYLSYNEVSMPYEKRATESLTAASAAAPKNAKARELLKALRILALHKTMLGLDLMEKNRLDEARSSFEEALSIDGYCVPAYLYLGDYYRVTGRSEDAVEIWGKFAETMPDISHYVFNRLEDVLYELGSFDSIEGLYETILALNPDNRRAIYALAAIYEKRGDLNGAINLVQSILEKFPDSLGARQHLISYYHKLNDPRKAVQLALEISGLKGPQRRDMHKCTECGYESPVPFWQCPECYAWRGLNDV